MSLTEEEAFKPYTAIQDYTSETSVQNLSSLFFVINSWLSLKIHCMG